MEENENLLVVILDINQSQWIDKQDVFQKFVDSVMVFCNSYLMFHHSNQLSVYTCDTVNATMLYPAEPIVNQSGSILHDGKFELFEELNGILSSGLKKVINKGYSTNQSEAVSKLSGAFSQALCYIHKKSSGEQRLTSRILILKSSVDVSAQYMSIMNCIFASQKNNITVDACSLFTKSGFMQQAADITCGTYHFVENTNALLELMLWIYLPNQNIRHKLKLPSNIEIDYRAACFCHKRLVEIGFVCSVCLSIYCQFMPKCSTCQTRFKLPQLPAMKAKKKKKIV